MTGIFGGAPKPAPAPAPAVMPTQDDAAVKAARLQTQQAAMARSGRQSTILSDYGNSGSDKLG